MVCYEFLFLRVMNAKVELGHGLKVLDKDVGCSFAEVFALGIQDTQAQNLLFAASFVWYSGLGHCCREYLQQITSGKADFYSEGMF